MIATSSIWLDSPTARLEFHDVYNSPIGRHIETGRGKEYIASVTWWHTVYLKPIIQDVCTGDACAFPATGGE